MTTDPTARPTPTPAPVAAHRPTVLWQVDVLDEDIDPSDPVQVAQAAYHRILSSRMLPVLRVLLADGTTVDVDLDARRGDAATTVATTPTRASVAVPEEVQYALDYARTYWRHGQEPKTQRALHVLAHWIEARDEGTVREEIAQEIEAAVYEHRPSILGFGDGLRRAARIARGGSR